MNVKRVSSIITTRRRLIAANLFILIAMFNQISSLEVTNSGLSNSVLVSQSNWKRNLRGSSAGGSRSSNGSGQLLLSDGNRLLKSTEKPLELRHLIITLSDISSSEDMYFGSVKSTEKPLELRHLIITLSDISSSEDMYFGSVKFPSVDHFAHNYKDYVIDRLLGIDKIRQNTMSEEDFVKGRVECHHEKSQILSSLRPEGEFIVAVSACQDNTKFFESLEQNPFVTSIEDDIKMTTLNETDTNSPEPSLIQLDELVPYGLKSVRADNISPANRTLPPVTLCVVDTGIFLSHNDFPTVGITGDDSPTAGPWDVDDIGHGTHVAGILVAQGGNGMGTRGIINDLGNSNINLHITRSHGPPGVGGRMSDVLSAVTQCRQKGAKVINLSVGCNGCYSIIHEMLFSELYEEGILVVSAAGNNGSSSKSYPASYGGVVSVASVTYMDTLSDRTQINDQVELAAPGSSVYSTGVVQDNYTTKSGTSMASPHVAGVATLLFSHYPECSANEIRNVLAKSARDLGEVVGCDEKFGFGVPQADFALDYLGRVGCRGVELILGDRGGCDVLDKNVITRQSSGVSEKNEIGQVESFPEENETDPVEKPKNKLIDTSVDRFRCGKK
eukprot:CAMPEP_0194442860 /NCGR_PEP_ID=MMETSP0176-20130528/126373_1 /TAXON_ID=216777 /ORGANISM="Proboscia alata, Strain PI-D3" /LENGTH=613 /DNA_ID=CAMNT_0039269017 /DNA_START=101 /DNA_END=1939 /DNA_ORIENTATION=-